MTVELRSTIELKDITAVEFRCACGNACIRKLDNLLDVPASCGNSTCKLTWWPVNDPNLQTFLRSIAVAKERYPLLRFHIEGLNGARAKP